VTPDLSTTYLGLRLRSPIVASASPLTGDLESLRALEDAGIGAAVLPSLFEEQIEHEELDLHELLEHATHSFGEAETWFPELEGYNTGPTSYLDHIKAAKEAVAVPVIASLNGVTSGGWLRYARLCQEAERCAERTSTPSKSTPSAPVPRSKRALRRRARSAPFGLHPARGESRAVLLRVRHMAVQLTEAAPTGSCLQSLSSPTSTSRLSRSRPTDASNLPEPA
jgi:hypothetical protein